MNFIAATDAPVVHVIDGQAVSFPLTTNAALCTLCAYLSLRRVEAATFAAKAADCSAIEKTGVIERAKFLGAAPYEVYEYARTYEGAMDVLTRSLVSGGATAELAATCAARVPLLEIVPLALLVLRVTNPADQTARPTDS